LFTALASFLDARANNGKWLLRIDNLDTPRNQLGAIDSIFHTLEAFGLHWDSAVYYQSQHLQDYEHYLAKLAQDGLTYRCVCSRKDLAGLPDNIANPHKMGVYPGTCRDKLINESTPHAIRLKTDAIDLSFEDGLQGEISCKLLKEGGDFILKRRDNIIAYQFAVVIDDYLQGINQIVRGCDLLHETPKQIYLQHKLGFPTPAYKHVPVLVDEKGYKLSKQTLATAVDINTPKNVVFDLLVLLKQNPPDDLNRANVNEMLAWAIQQWRPMLLIGLQQIPCA
jgi:glutamyl-Q tRNA(Asp) synthetase